MKKKQYVKPEIHVKKIKINFFVNGDRWSSDVDQLVFMDVYAASGCSDTGSC